MSDKELEVFVSRIDQAAEGVLLFSLNHPKGEKLPEWEAGAHIDVVVNIDGKPSVRQYSLCSNPALNDTWQIAVRLNNDGRGGSRNIHKTFSSGSTINVSRPRNSFPLVPAKRYLFIAGGIGITPILPMIATADRQKAEWYLLYCGRDAESMPFTRQLSSQYGDAVEFHESSKDGRADLKTVLNRADQDTEIYCCGPNSMLEEIKKICSAKSFDRLHYEHFSAAENKLDGRQFEVVFARSGITTTVPSDKSILQVAEENGVDIDSSCQEGVCGACETRVIDGTPDHRDTVLSAKERTAGRSIMVCVSRCNSPRLVLDA